jgi:hypothetical protein
LEIGRLGLLLAELAASAHHRSDDTVGNTDIPEVNDLVECEVVGDR